MPATNTVLVFTSIVEFAMSTFVALPAVNWYLTATPGSTIDYTFVAQQVAQLVADNDVQALVVDPAFIASFIEACEAIGLAVWRYEGPGKPEGRGLKMISHAQGKRVMFEDKQLCMPQSITKAEDRVLEQRIRIDASPVTYSCAANAAMDEDGHPPGTPAH